MMPSPMIEEEEVHLGDYLAVLKRRWRIIALVALAALLGALGASLWMTPIYEATLLLQIGEPQSVPLFRELEVLSPRPDPLASEIETLKSRTIAEEVVKKLHLDRRLHPLPKGLSLSMSPIGVEGEVEPGTYTVRLTDDQGGFEVFDPRGRRLGGGKKGVPFKGGGVSFTLTDVRAKEGDEFRFTLVEFQAAVAGLQGRTEVKPIRNTNVVQVKVQAEDPKEAAETANALAEAYIASTVERRTRQAFSTKAFIARQLGPLQEDLRKSEEALSRYKAEKGIVTLSEEADRILQQLTQAEIERGKLQAQRQEAEAILALLQQPRRDPSQPLVISTAGIPNPVLADLARRLTDLELKRANLSQTYTERHPSVRLLEAQIQEAKGKLTQEVEAALNTLRERERALGGVLRRYEAKLKGLPQAELGLVGLLRTSKVSEELYTFMLQKHEEARIAEASEIGSARVVDLAIPPKTPIKPRTKRNMLFGGVVGLMLGIGLAFFQEYLDRSVRSVGDLERRVNLPVFGVIPEIPDSVPTGRRRRIARPNPFLLITQIGPRAPALEAYRSLRTNIQFAAPEAPARTFLLTSPGPREGKSTTVANLAIALAQMGGRILLVDADLRKPVLYELFQSPREAGLSEILVGNLHWRDGIRPTEVQNLHFLPSGHLPPNPAELLGSKRMKLLLQELAQNYEVILLDSPPVLLFTDASILGSMVDGVFLVVRAGETTPEAISRAKALLSAVNAKVIGAILNSVRLEDSGGLYGYPRYHDYSHYYGEVEGGADHQRGWLMRLKHGIQRWNPWR